MVRAKFRLTEERVSCYGGKTLVFQTQHDSSIPEDMRFQKASPSGRLEIMVDNPAALEKLHLGKDYYLDFTQLDS